MVHILLRFLFLIVRKNYGYFGFLLASKLNSTMGTFLSIFFSYLLLFLKLSLYILCVLSDFNTLHHNHTIFLLILYVKLPFQTMPIFIVLGPILIEKSNMFQVLDLSIKSMNIYLLKNN